MPIFSAWVTVSNRKKYSQRPKVKHRKKNSNDVCCEVTSYITYLHAQYNMYIQSKMSHHDTQRRWQSSFQFSKRVFLGRRRAKLSMLSSSLFFTLSGSWHGVVYARLRMCVCVHVCGRALVCMPVWLTHSAVNSVILGGPAVQGLHWHPTLVLKREQTHTRTQSCSQKHTTHSLKYTCTNTHTSLALLRLRFSIFSSITFHCCLF